MCIIQNLKIIPRLSNIPPLPLFSPFHIPLNLKKNLLPSLRTHTHPLTQRRSHNKTKPRGKKKTKTNYCFTK